MAPASPLNRREFFQASAAVGATAALGSAATAAAPVGTAKSCIFLMLTGGPSQLDTWDPKPDAPSEVRGPFAPNRTRVPGVLLSELFPKMAAMADKFSLVRTMHHEHAPIHENGMQLLNTGRRFGDGPVWPNVGIVIADRLDREGRFGKWLLTPDNRIKCGLDIPLGQWVGFLGGRPYTCISQAFNGRTQALDTSIATSCETALEAVNDGTPFVIVNHFLNVFDAVSWDCHADKGSLRTTLADYRDEVAPAFDAAYTTLLTRLEETGKLAETLVVAVGEFGRTPKLNCNGGRDHWANCWTALVAGGGVQGGRVVGTSDAHAAEPKDRPVHCAELVSTICHAMGVPPTATIPGPDGQPARVVEAAPVLELF
jgi:hypothetical protein